MLWWVPRKASELLWRSFETQITLSSILCLCSNAIEYLQLPPTTTVLGLGIILLWGRCPLLQIYLLIDTLISVSVCVCTKKTHICFSVKGQTSNWSIHLQLQREHIRNLSQIHEGSHWRSFMSVVRVSDRSKWNSISRAARQHRRNDSQRAAHRERSDSAVETSGGRQNSLFHFRAAPRLYLHRC